MAITQTSKIQIRSGELADLPQLAVGEFGLATDAKKLFIGNGNEPSVGPLPQTIEILTTSSELPSPGNDNQVLFNNDGMLATVGSVSANANTVFTYDYLAGNVAVNGGRGLLTVNNANITDILTTNKIEVSDTITTAKLTVTGTASINSATATNTTLNGGYTEQVFTVSGTTPALSPTNGSIQTWQLSGASTPTAGTWASGQSMTLMVDDGSGSAITWTSLPVTWETPTGVAPILSTTNLTVIVLWKVDTTIYGIGA